MKYCTVIICFGVLCIFFNSCKKDTAEKNNTNAAAITGTWELESMYGDVPVINYPPGNGNIITFTDLTYSKYANGGLIKSGHYTIVQDTSVMEATGILIAPGQYTNRIIFDNDPRKIFIEILNNKLTFLSGFFPTDGGSSMTYRRKEN
jgi:hypothetical protein